MDFKFPDVGEGITEGKLVSWHVKPGEYIKKEQTIASVETDKAVVDIPSPVSGTVEKLNGKEGEVIFVGNTLAIINDGSQTSNSSNNIKENTNNIKASQSNSNNYQIPQTKQDYSVSQNEIKQSSYQSKSEYQNFNSNTSNNSNQILAMPIVRRASKIKGINLSNISGSGNHNQILLSDLKLKLSDVIDVKFDRISDNSKSFSLNSQNVSENISNQPSQNIMFNSKDYSSILATPSTKKLAR
ncbi:MAG TPA: biotin/lipoyl-containing protein, partial [Allocoleopsis sp.]